MLASSVTLADNGTYPNILAKYYGVPEILSEGIEIFNEGITICYFPGEAIVLLYKESENAGQINSWTINGINKLEEYVDIALANKAIKTVFLNYSTGEAKQYPDDFSLNLPANNIERYDVYETFLLSLVPKATPEPTKKPAQTTPKPAKQPTKAPTQPPTKEPPTPTPAPVWGSWSEWSTEKVNSSDTRQVETKMETITKTQYTYKHWHYTHKKNGAQNSYAEYKGSQYVSGSGKWEYYTTSTPLKQTDTKDGQKRYKVNGVSWYWETKNEKIEEIIYYRYRDLL